MSFDENRFYLTPLAGDNWRDVREVAEAANLLSSWTGHRQMETSQGRNLAPKLSNIPLRLLAQEDWGKASLTALPFLDGTQLVLPRCRLILEGEPYLLEGEDGDGAQRIDLSPLESGDYALLLEGYRALVGATTQGQATEPAIYAGVVDGQNKPDATHFYPAGNLSRSGGGIPDRAFVGTTTQVYKFEQWQYRLRLVRDRNLIGAAPEGLVPAGVTYQTSSRLGVDLLEATVPLTLGEDLAYARSFERTIYGMKLAVVRKTNAPVLELLVNDPSIPSDYAAVGQTPLPLSLSRSALLASVRSQLESVRLELLGQVLRIEKLEELSQPATDLVSLTDQVIQPRSFSGGLPQTLVWGGEQADPQLWHDPVTYPGRVQLDFAGRVTLAAHAQFAASASGVRWLRVRKNGLETALMSSAPNDTTYPSAISLTGELSVSAGDFLEIEALHSAPGALNVLMGAAFSVRRVV